MFKAGWSTKDLTGERCRKCMYTNLICLKDVVSKWQKKDSVQTWQMWKLCWDALSYCASPALKPEGNRNCGIGTKWAPWSCSPHAGFKVSQWTFFFLVPKYQEGEGNQSNAVIIKSPRRRDDICSWAILDVPSCSINSVYVICDKITGSFPFLSLIVTCNQGRSHLFSLKKKNW